MAEQFKDLKCVAYFLLNGNESADFEQSTTVYIVTHIAIETMEMKPYVFKFCFCLFFKDTIKLSTVTATSRLDLWWTVLLGFTPFTRKTMLLGQTRYRQF